jgi:hypothetical protein
MPYRVPSPPVVKPPRVVKKSWFEQLDANSATYILVMGMAVAGYSVLLISVVFLAWAISH